MTEHWHKEDEDEPVGWEGILRFIKSSTLEAMVSRFLSGGAEAKKASAFSSSSLSIALTFPCNHNFNAMRNWIATTSNRLGLKFGQSSSVLCTHNVKCKLIWRNYNSQVLKIRETLNFKRKYQLVLEKLTKDSASTIMILAANSPNLQNYSLENHLRPLDQWIDKVDVVATVVQNTIWMILKFKHMNSNSSTRSGLPKGCAQWLTLLLSKSTNCIFGITIEARVIRFPMSNRFYHVNFFRFQSTVMWQVALNIFYMNQAVPSLWLWAYLADFFSPATKIEASVTDKIREFASVYEE